MLLQHQDRVISAIIMIWRAPCRTVAAHRLLLCPITVHIQRHSALAMISIHSTDSTSQAYCRPCNPVNRSQALFTMSGLTIITLTRLINYSSDSLRSHGKRAILAQLMNWILATAGTSWVLILQILWIRAEVRDIRTCRDSVSGGTAHQLMRITMWMTFPLNTKYHRVMTWFWQITVKLIIIFITVRKKGLLSNMLRKNWQAISNK